MSDLASTSEKDGGLPEAAYTGAPYDHNPPEAMEGRTVQYVYSSGYATGRAHAADAVAAALASPAPAESGEPVIVDADRYTENADTLLIYLRGCLSRADEDRMVDVPVDYITSAIVLLATAHPPAESAGSPSTSGAFETCAKAAEDAAQAQSQFQKSAYARGDDIGGHGHWKAQCELLNLAARLRAFSAAPTQDPSRDTQPALLSTDETKEGGNG